VLDHFGWFGLVEREMTLPRVFGAVLLMAGVVLIQFSATPAKAVIAAS
jgi:transporter family-2 protein